MKIQHSFSIFQEFNQKVKLEFSLILIVKGCCSASYINFYLYCERPRTLITAIFNDHTKNTHFIPEQVCLLLFGARDHQDS